MNKARIIFVHGWSSSPDLWDAIIEHLSGFQCHRVNIGFTGEADYLDHFSGEPCVYVTHSLGTMWTLKNRVSSMQALIAINGFSCFKGFTTPRILKRMQASLQRSPEDAINDFCQTAGLPMINQFNDAKLHEGLDWLLECDYSDALVNLGCPVISIFADHDAILDFELMKQHWAGFQQVPLHNGGHALPVLQPQACADIIRESIHAL